jgi:Xaa-Pro aminopeptidase
MHNFAKRRDRLRTMLRHLGARAMLVTNETNVSYLTGFSGDSSYLLLTDKHAILLSDSRYETQIAEECGDIEAAIRTASIKMTSLVGQTVGKAKLSNLVIESESISKSLFDQLESELGDCELILSSGWVEQLRAVKDQTEIQSIRNSILVSQRAFEVIRAQLNGDQTERQVANNLEHQIRAFGGRRCAFEPIVAVGSRAALPHGGSTDRRIGEGPFVLIDWGAMVKQYASDLTRVLVTARIPPKLIKIYEIVLQAQSAAIKKIKPGVAFRDVDRAARRVIESAGFAKNFGHGLGHGFGLEIHELPRLAPIATGDLKANMVVTVEPGIYLPGWGGVRIEDDVLVTRDGHQILTDVPKEIDQCKVDLS